MKNSSHLVDLFEMLKTFNLKGVVPIQIFYPRGLFSKHLSLVSYGNLFTNIKKGIEDNEIET